MADGGGRTRPAAIRRWFAWFTLATLLLPIATVSAQERGAAAMGSALQGLGVNTRVLIIGAHPDDEDTQVIAWLSRGRHVETAYLSLTRGDAGSSASITSALALSESLWVWTCSWRVSLSVVEGLSCCGSPLGTNMSG